MNLFLRVQIFVGEVSFIQKDNFMTWNTVIFKNIFYDLY